MRQTPDYPGVNRAAARQAGWLIWALPALGWMRGYTRSDLKSDTLAGIVTALLQVPQAMAYALLAGLPPQVGLYASVTAPIAYALFGSSRHLAVGPVSVTAIMVAAALTSPSVQGQGTGIENALVIALEVGLILLAMATLRLGGLVTFLSHPVLSGFTSGAAILILLTQIPSLLGIASTPTMTVQEILAGIYRQVAALKPTTAAVGVASVALLALTTGPLQAWLRRASGKEWSILLGGAGPLVVIVLAILAVISLDLDRTGGVATVGPIPAGLPLPDLGFLRLNTWIALFPSAFLIAIVSYVSGVSVAKILANRQRRHISANQELAALGAANVAAAFSAGMPVAGSFTRTMVNFATGAKTQGATIAASFVIGLTLLFFAPLFARLPNAALAAIIVVAVIPLIDLYAVRRLWRYARSDAAVLLLTLSGVLIFGIEIGLVIGLLVSLTAYIWRTSHPHVAVVGRIRGTEHFRNVKRYDVETWPTIAFIRVDESLTFANIGTVEDGIMAHLSRHPDVKHLVLVCSAVNHIDSSALEALERLMANLREAGVAVHLAEVKGPVFDALKRAGLTERMSPGLMFFRTNDAVAGLLRSDEQDEQAQSESIATAKE